MHVETYMQVHLHLHFHVRRDHVKMRVQWDFVPEKVRYRDIFPIHTQLDNVTEVHQVQFQFSVHFHVYNEEN
jgi:hypothetical protein